MLIYRKEDASLVVPCGLGTVVCPEGNYSLQMKQVDPSTFAVHVEPDASYYGLYRVIVNPVTSSIDPNLLASNIRRNITILGVAGSFDGGDLQSKTVNSSTAQQIVVSDSDFYGLSNITILPYTLESKSQVITVNGDYTIAPVEADALSQVILNVSVAGSSPVLQSKSVNSSTSTQTVTPDEGYNGLSTVTVTPYTLDTKTVNPSINAITVNSSADGLSSVTVNAITAAIDPDLIASNIKKDVEILGVTGSFEGGTLQSKTVNSSTSSQTVSPDGANYGLSSVTVNPYTVESKSDTITANGQYTYNPSTADALSGVTIDVQVADIPAVIQTKSVTYNHNGNYTVTKDAGYDGMSSVSIEVDVDDTVDLEPAKTVNSSTVSQTVTYDNTQYDGLSSVTINPYTLENKTVNSSTSQQTVTATSADGLAQVTVEPYTLDSKTVNPSTNSQTVTSSEDGLSSVTVNAVDSNIDPNILSNNIKNGVTILGITGSYVGQTIINQNKTVNSSTASQSITADNGYTGLGTVTVNPYTLDSKTVNPSVNSQTVNSSVDGLSSVTVNAVTASIDSNIQAGNIKDGVTILGVQGTYTGSVINNQNKTVNPSTNSQSVTADAGYTGLGTVTVNPMNLIHYNVAPGMNDQTIRPGTGYDGLDYVYIAGVSNYLQALSVNPSTGSQSFTLPAPWLGYDSVTVNAVTSSIDSNIAAGNIKDGVTILGVTGTYTGSGLSDIYTEWRKGNITDISSIDITDLMSIGSGAVNMFNVNDITIIPRYISKQPVMDSSVITDGAMMNCFNHIYFTGDAVDITFPYLESINGSSACYYMFYNTPGVRSISFPELTSISGFRACQNALYTNYTTLQEISMPKLTDVAQASYILQNLVALGQGFSYKLTVHPLALRYVPTSSNNNQNIAKCFSDYLVTLVLSSNATDDVRLDNNGGLNSESVYNVLSHLDLTVSGKSVVFRSTGLTVTDYQDGRIQTAYNDAINAGWTISNLTINPYS